MTDTPRTPVFDEHGWCHQMEDAPKNKDANGKAIHLWGYSPNDEFYFIFHWAVFDAETAKEYDAPGCWVYSEELIADVEGESLPTAWRYPPAPPVGE